MGYHWLCYLQHKTSGSKLTTTGTCFDNSVHKVIGFPDWKMSLADRLLKLVWSKGAPAALEPRSCSHLDAAHPVSHRHEGALGCDVVHHQDPVCLPEILLGDAPKPEPRHNQSTVRTSAVQWEVTEWDYLSVSAGSLRGLAWCVPLSWCLHTDPRTSETGQAAVGKRESWQMHGAGKARKKTFAGQEERSRRIYLGGIRKGNFLWKGKLMEKTWSFSIVWKNLQTKLYHSTN